MDTAHFSVLLFIQMRELKLYLKYKDFCLMRLGLWHPFCSVENIGEMEIDPISL